MPLTQPRHINCLTAYTRERDSEGPSHFRFVEKGYRRGENVYAAMGQTNSGRYLIVFFVRKTTREALIVSARDMTASERKRYEKS